MKKHMLEGVLAVVGVAALAVAVPASADDARFPLRDPSYKVWMARAMDQCVPSGTTIVPGIGTNDPTAGCLQANVTTDEPPPTDPQGSLMNYGFLSVKRTAGPNFKGNVHFFGAGFATGQRVKVRLTLRVTHNGTHTKHPPGSNKRVTFADVTIECGNQSPGCFTARPNGAIAGTQSLDDCLIQNGEPRGLRTGNVEILNSELVNCDTGKVLGRPGIKQAANSVR